MITCNKLDSLLYDGMILNNLQSRVTAYYILRFFAIDRIEKGYINSC